MRKYKQLTWEQRYTIFCLDKKGMSYRKIADVISVSPSTISRELRRNLNEQGKYYPKQADLFARERHEWKRHPRKMNERIKQEIRELICNHQWSPEQIVGRYKLEGKTMVGKNTIYNFLHEDKRQGGSLYLLCRHALKHRRRRLSVPITSKKPRKNILERPQCIDEQQRMGDFEMDLIIGANGTDLAIIEALPQGRKAKPLAKAVIKRLGYLKRRGQLHSITTDNGSEFMAFDKIERDLKIPVYFARPYTSTDKPHVEHLNTLIRQYLPKGSAFIELKKRQIAHIENNLNNRPRKKLNFRTPFECFFLNLQ